MRPDIKKIFLSAAAGILCFFAFPPFDLSILAWFCLVPLLMVIKDSKPREAFLYSYLAGVVYFGCLFYWMPQVSVPGAIALVLIMAAYYGLFGSVAGIVLKYSMDILLLPFAWVVLEYLRSHVFTGFPWGILGYSQYRNINLIQIADFTGVYGVSFVLVAFNAAVFAALARSKRKIMYMMIALMFIILSTSYGRYRLDNMSARGTARVSVVQGNIPQGLKWDTRYAKDILGTYADLTRRAAEDKPDLIIWPETAYPYLVGRGDDPAEEISSLAKELGVPILAGVIYSPGDGYYNSAVLFSGGKGFERKYDKLHLVPWGEYVPFGGYASFLRDHIDKPIGDFRRGSGYTLFPLRSMQYDNIRADGALVRQINMYKFGALICYEDIFPYIARGFVKKGADMLVNMTNDAWFGDTGAPRQHMQASVFRAVENRVPVVRAANTGVSCFIGPTGKIVSTLEVDGKDVWVSGYDTAKVDISAARSRYTVYGDLFVYLSGFILALLFIMEHFMLRSR